ncbi:30S ribosomal protein S15 [Candidatus Bathyarchaeota archaeon]|nr:MAG: 30S ribosomal protein S15 [Candidatus Bathyarchaeota archaeon]
MPKKEKGRSHSTRPISKRSPSWCRYTSEEVESLIVKLAREGNPPSKIGVILRDQYGIPLAKAIVGKGIVEVLKENNLAPPIPEDLDALLRKAARLRAHLERNRADRYNRRAVQTVESKIRSLSEYYKRKGVLPPDWKYTPTAIAV